MKVFILGSDGQLGSEFVREYESRGIGSDLCKATIDDFDISDIDRTRSFILDISAELIINCAGYTAVDDCERNPDLAYRVNATGSKNVAMCAQECNASLVYISTDYVFDGTKTGPYTEFDIPNPLNVYGKSKLSGEDFVRECTDKYYIIRTSWLYGPRGHNFLKTILRLSQQNSEIKVVNDQKGTPTDTKSLVLQILRIVDKGEFGIYNASCNGSCTWYEFACEIIRLAGLDTKVIPITTDEFPLPAKRPANSVLDNYKLRLRDNDIMPDWIDSLTSFLNNNSIEELLG